MLHVPDGREVRFYSWSHTQIDPTAPLIVDDAIVSARAKDEKVHSGLAAPMGAKRRAWRRVRSRSR